jgi:hypothetical protein
MLVRLGRLLWWASLAFGGVLATWSLLCVITLVAEGWAESLYELAIETAIAAIAAVVVGRAAKYTLAGE